MNGEHCIDTCRNACAGQGATKQRQGKGSHEIWYSPPTKRTSTVPANLSPHRLANEILKQAGLSKAF